jgi:hypothetical protein
MLFQFRHSLFIILLMVELTGRLLGRSHSRIFMPDLHCIVIMPANVCPFDTTIIHPNEQVNLRSDCKTVLDLEYSS